MLLLNSVSAGASCFKSVEDDPVDHGRLGVFFVDKLISLLGLAFEK